jgi:hypothetical protein
MRKYIAVSLFLATFSGCMTTSRFAPETTQTYYFSQDVTANNCEIFTNGYAALIGGPERTLCIGELWPKRESVFFKKGATVKVQRILQLKGIDTFSTTAELRITDDGTKKSTTAYIDWPEGLRYLTIGAK